MKSFFISIGISIITTVHSILNKFEKDKKRKGILYSTYTKRTNVLRPIQKKLSGTTIFSLNIFEPESIIRRENKSEVIRFANIITKPFIHICIEEKKFREKLANYLYINQKKFLEKNNFSGIVLIDEFSMPHRMLVKAAKETKTITFAIQHGTICKNHKGYSSYKKRTTKEIVDHIITYSEKEKKILTENSNIRPQQIETLGCSRYDNIANYQTNKEKIKQRNKIPKKKILFWPTQTHDLLMSKNGENELNAETVFMTLKKMKEWFLIIKLHPNEPAKKSRKFYKQKAKKYNVTNYILLDYTNEKTLDCINIADAVIIKHSTVGVESILLKKPVINFELKETGSLEQYKKLKTKMIIKKNEDLELFLEKLKTKEYKELFQKEQKKYEKDHFNNFGLATEKFIVLLKKQMKK